MLSRRTSSKCCGVSLVAIGVVVNTALYFNIVGRSSSNVSNPSNVHNVSNHAHAHANMVEDFYFGVTADIKGWKYTPSDREADIQKEIEMRLQAASEKKIILFWVPPIAVKKLLDEPDRNHCGNCEFSYNRSHINDSRTGAVVYHFNTVQLSDMPKHRNPQQLHIFLSMESPGSMLNAHLYTLDMEESFGMNATLGYRIDSDFLLTHQTKLTEDHIMGNDDSIYEEILKTKTKFAIVVISDCAFTPAARVRMALIKNLMQSGLRIDTFGGCFSNMIDPHELEKIIRLYKFYFAYENSLHCKDYITEKFFVHPLTHGSVPVVWGGAKEDYLTISPPDSFIFAEDFRSPKQLIEYLEMLERNDEEYLKFFRWRTMKASESLPFFDRTRGPCAICRVLHGINADNRFNPRYQDSNMPLFSDNISTRIIPSMRRYLYDDDRPECFNKWEWL